MYRTGQGLKDLLCTCLDVVIRSEIAAGSSCALFVKACGTVAHAGGLLVPRGTTPPRLAGGGDCCGRVGVH